MRYHPSPIENVYLGLGSNVDAEENLAAAARELRDLYPDIRFSSVYRTSPQDAPDQPDFFNAVAAIQTDDEPTDIAQKIQHIEQKLHKNPPYRFGPRTIDIDLLLVGDKILPSLKEWKERARQNSVTELVLPHVRMHLRRFVLEPLSELTGGTVVHPVFGQSVQSFLATTMDQQCTKEDMRL